MTSSFMSMMDVIKKILSRDSNYLVDMVMWLKFGISNISMREVIIISILYGLDQKHRFEGWSWFKFNNVRLALGMNLKFHTSVAKGLKLKVRKFWELIPTFAEVKEENLIGGWPFCSHPPILNSIKTLWNVDQTYSEPYR